MRITNMLTSSGNPAANQFILYEDDGTLTFKSYKTTIAKLLPDGTTYLDPNHDCSRTTAKYRNIFLGGNSQTIKEKIADGTYTIKDLNQ